MNSTTRRTIVGAFTRRVDAERAVEELRDQGFGRDHVGLVGRNTDDIRGKDSNLEFESQASGGAAAGAVAGAGLGALVGLGILAGAIPAIGPAIAGGTLGIILTNAAGGAALAGVAGALIGMGVPEDEAQFFEDELREGRTIVTVETGGREDLAESILEKHGAHTRMPSLV